MPMASSLNKVTVLTVDDDQALQVVMRQYFEQQGCRFVSAHSGKEMIERLSLQDPDIILLDLGLPDHDGLSLLNVIQKKSHAPVIVISGRNETADRIIGLEMGADDYVIKPFEMRELLAHVKAVLRRYENAVKSVANETENTLSDAKRLTFDGWTLDRLQYQLFGKDGQSAELTCGEFKMLEALMLSCNRVLSREYLFEPSSRAVEAVPWSVPRVPFIRAVRPNSVTTRTTVFDQAAPSPPAAPSSRASR